LPAVLFTAFTACGQEPPETARELRPCVVAVSPHPDDETIIGGAALYKAAHDGRTRVEIIYVTSGDAAGLPGPCGALSEEEKRARIVELREGETRAACAVLGIAPAQLHFLRFREGLVQESEFREGRRWDVLSSTGQQALAAVLELLPQRVGRDATSLTVITSSMWDAHPDHRAVYQAARAAAEFVRGDFGIPVTLLHAIAHDEIPADLDFCCLGDLHWPNPGPHLEYTALLDFPQRPRPPCWDLVQDITELVPVRTAALKQHVSQVEGWPELCMVLVLKSYYRYWMEKTEEVFYEERF
jgi:LmbE family N-acetylglucosaminyl deacetylase